MQADKRGQEKEILDMKRLASIVLAKCSMKMLGYMLHSACRRLNALHTNGWSEVAQWGAFYLVARMRPNVHGSHLAADSYKSLDRNIKESVKRVS